MEYQKELVEKAQKGSYYAFSQLYEEIYLDLFKMAYYTLGNRMDAEDVVAEAVIDAWKSIGRLRAAEAFGSWMLRILMRKCKGKLREYIKHKNQVDIETVDEKEWCEYDCTDEREMGYDIEQAFRVLEHQERMIVSLSFWSGYNSTQIGEMLQMNPSTVRSKLKRSLEKMRDRLEVYHGQQ